MSNAKEEFRPCPFCEKNEERIKYLEALVEEILEAIRINHSPKEPHSCELLCILIDKANALLGEKK
jgi:hypothetical protein